MSQLVNLGVPFEEGDLASNARRNATMVASLTGGQIGSIPISTQIPLFRCIKSEFGYYADELYMRTADNLGIFNTRRIHYHRQQTAEEQGSMLHILQQNPRITIFGQGPFNNIYDFNVTKLRTADFAYVVDPTYGRTLLLSSNWDEPTLSGNYVNASVAGQQIGFTDKMLAMAQLYSLHNANQVARVGFGMEEANNTVDPTRKVGMEMCDGTGLNWQAVSANGVTRSTSATSMNVAPIPNQFNTYRFYFDPETVQYKLTNLDGIEKIMTTTIPSGGAIDHTRLFRIGLHTTNPTLKHMWLLRLFFIAPNVDPTWFSGPDF